MSYLITPEVLNEKLDIVKVIDVRHDLVDHAFGRKAYEKSHIPNAIFFDHETDLCGPKTSKSGRHPLPDRRHFAKLLASTGISLHDEIVTYDCGSLMFASHMWWLLRWLGIQNVRVLNGGFDAWVDKGLYTTSSILKLKPVDEWLPLKPLVRLISMSEVQENLKDAKFKVLDARVEGRFNGDFEPMDPVAGHIPGALNHPADLNFNYKGELHSKEKLRQIFLDISSDPKAIVHQCGSGITACLNEFAMEEAGLEGSGLYAGSWSEWIAYPENPVVTKT